MALSWDGDRRRYRDTATNKLLTRKQAVALRDDLADVYSARFQGITRQYGQGGITRQAWERGFRALITEASSAGYAFGRGGVGLMTDGDYTTLLNTIERQLSFGDEFFREVRSQIEIDREGKLAKEIKAALLPQIEARAGMYGGSVVNAAEIGSTAAVSDGLLSLPAYPADGDTECRSNCRCAWQIDERDGMWVCEWQTEGDDRVCDGCTSRGQTYNPLIVPMRA